jgi:hypothetical protein
MRPYTERYEYDEVGNILIGLTQKRPCEWRDR